MEWVKVPANHTPDKQLIYNIYKEFIKFKSKKPNTIQFKNGQKT